MSDDISFQIMSAAERRFADYGCRKTTMAEIAADCQMSVGNLYRHYSNKSAIIGACINSLTERKYTVGVEAAASAQEPCARLRAFLLARLHFFHGKMAGNRHLFEFVLEVHESHQDVLLHWEKQVIQFIQAELEAGMASGDLRQGDAARVAYLIHQSLQRYNMPLSLRANSLAVLEQDLLDYLQLLFQGLRSPDT